MMRLYKKNRIYYLIVIFALITSNTTGLAFAQSPLTVSGTVTSEEGLPLPGVTIMVEGTSQGTVTDFDGNYTLQVPDPNSTLVFSFIGFVTREVDVNGDANIDVTLSEDTEALDEVVVIGYGTRERRDVVGSISSMDSDEIAESVALSPELAMQGRMPGVLVTSGGGNPNARPTVRIRGVGTFGNAEPLYVVDGIPITEHTAWGSDIRGSQNIMNMINPNDIESISVLKDAAASAIYGVRAANGVILITTKSGKVGKPRIEMSGHRGVQNITDTYDVLNTQQLVELINESFDNRPAEEANRPLEAQPGSDVYRGNDPTYDWQTPLLNRNAVIEDYSVRISGGSEATTYYVGGGYSKTESVLINNSNDRYSLSANVETKPNKYISTGVTYRLSYLEGVDNTIGNLPGMVNTTPWQPIYDRLGPGGYAEVVDVNYVRNPDYDPSRLDPGYPYNMTDITRLYGIETNSNNFALMNFQDRDYHVLRNMGNAFIEVEPFTGLRIRGNLQVDWIYNKRITWDSYEGELFNITPENPFRGVGGLSKGSYGERETRNLTLNKEFLVNYTKDFGQHNIDATFLATDYEFQFRTLDISDSDNPSADPLKRGVDNRAPFVSGFTGRDRASLLGYMGRISYNYAGRYYLDLVARRDGSFKFAPGYKWGTFPAVSAAWRISDEGFMAGMPFVSDLRIRAGWGQLGNQETRSFAYLSRLSTVSDYGFGSGNGNFQGNVSSGVHLPDFPVVDLSWETAETSNIGIDGSFLNNKISVTAEYYINTRRDILQAAALPASVGNQSQPVLNIASVRNSGVELSGNYYGNVGEFSFNFGGNITTVKNRVLKTFQNQPFGGSGGRIEVGMPMNYLWGHEVGGIFQTQEELDEYQATYDDSRGNNQAVGDMWFRDLYGNPTEEDREAGRLVNPTPDNIVNNNDRTYLGKTIPGYYYGINIGANFHNFDLSALFQGIGDVQKYNGVRAGYESLGTRGVNQLATTLNRWTPENPSTTMPRAVYGDPAGNTRFSSRFVEDAGFLRLKNVQLGYSLPQNISESLGFIRAFRIYAAGNNVFTATEWSGLDPENDNIPNPRSFLLGLTATF